MSAMEEDDGLIDFLKWHNDTANYQYEHQRIPISRFDGDLNDRFLTVVGDLTNVRLIKTLHEDGISPSEISREQKIPYINVLRILHNRRFPSSISYKFLESQRNKIKHLSEDELMMHLGRYVEHLIDNDEITVPNGNPTHSIQDLIYIKSDHFRKPFPGFKWSYAFQNLRTTWYQALIRKYVELPRLQGEQPLKITQYGDRPLRKWMFHVEIEGKWDDPDDRIDATHAMIDSLRFAQEDGQLQERHFVGRENPFNRSFVWMLEKLREIYGSSSFWIALIEADVLTPFNYQELKSNHPRLRMSKGEVAELYMKSRILLRRSRGNKLIKLLSEGHSLQDANIMLGLDLDRNELMLSLYFAGCTLEEIGERYTLSKERVRQIIDPYVKPLSEDEITFHIEARREKKVNRQLNRLYSEFEQIGITPYILDSLVTANLHRMDKNRLANLVGCNQRLIESYLDLKGMRCLSTKEADLLELQEIYHTGVGFDIIITKPSKGGHGYDVSSGNMQSHSNNTRNLFFRLTNRQGSGYKNILEQAGADPHDVYKRGVSKK